MLNGIPSDGGYVWRSIHYTVGVSEGLNAPQVSEELETPKGSSPRLSIPAFPPISRLSRCRVIVKLGVFNNPLDDILASREP